jgi:ATP-dependent RNA helicase SUPV3L1/SUV3
LERLADLIRPALAWRAGALGVKPQGAIDGFGFTVTVGMTSLAGCSGEGFASVLRSLGYRMEKRPKPPEPAPAAAPSIPAEPPAPVALAPEETVAGAPALADKDTEPVAAPAVDAEANLERPVAIEEPAPGTSAVEPAQEAVAPGEPLERAVHPVLAEAAEQVITVPEAPTLAVTGQEEQAEAAAEMPESSVPARPPETASKAEPTSTEFIEVWRPGRRDDHPRKPRHESGPRQRRPQRQRHLPPPAAAPDGSPAVVGVDGVTPPAAAASAEVSTVAAERRDGGRHRERPAGGARNDRPERQPRPDQRPEHRVRADRPGGPDHERGQRGGGRPPPRGDRPDRDPTLRAKYIKGRAEGRDRRDREPDPNSPFAKLAALKEQLEANAKEPR